MPARCAAQQYTIPLEVKHRVVAVQSAHELPEPKNQTHEPTPGRVVGQTGRDRFRRRHLREIGDHSTVLLFDPID